MVMKCSFDPKRGKFLCKNSQADAMLVKKEKVVGLCALPPDGLLLSIFSADFLVVRDMKVIQYIEEPF